MIMIVKHPTITGGWLIETDEVKRLYNAPHQLVIPDGTFIHPLYFTPVDFMDSDVSGARQYAISSLDANRVESRAGYGLTEAMYYEALRWQDNPSSRLALNPGRLSNEDYTNQVISRWDKIESDYNLGVSLVTQAQDVDTIAVILSRRV